MSNRAQPGYLVACFAFSRFGTIENTERDQTSRRCPHHFVPVRIQFFVVDPDKLLLFEAKEAIVPLDDQYATLAVRMNSEFSGPYQPLTCLLLFNMKHARERPRQKRSPRRRRFPIATGRWRPLVLSAETIAHRSVPGDCCAARFQPALISASTLLDQAVEGGCHAAGFRAGLCQLGIISRHYCAATNNGRFTSINGHESEIETPGTRSAPIIGAGANGTDAMPAHVNDQPVSARILWRVARSPGPRGRATGPYDGAFRGSAVHR